VSRRASPSSRHQACAAQPHRSHRAAASENVVDPQLPGADRAGLRTSEQVDTQSGNGPLPPAGLADPKVFEAPHVSDTSQQSVQPPGSRPSPQADLSPPRLAPPPRVATGRGWRFDDEQALAAGFFPMSCGRERPCRMGGGRELPCRMGGGRQLPCRMAESRAGARPGPGSAAGGTSPDDIWLSSTWPYVRDQLPPPPARVIELGCGQAGGHVPALVRAGYDATGVDPEAPEASACDLEALDGTPILDLKPVLGPITER